MKKVLVISGSPRPKGNTYKIIQVFKEQLNHFSGYEFEYINLKKNDLKYCRGCLLCMKKGEESCPCKDDALYVRDKLLLADGVIFTSPVYVHTVSALLKNFFDRFAYFCHRPQFVGKSALCIVTTELSGIEETVRYMKFPINAWGFQIAGCFGVVYPSYKENPSYKRKIDKRIKLAARRFHHTLETGKVDYSFQKFIFFNFLKTKVKLHQEQLPYDFKFWQNNGWLNMSFYTNKNVPVIKSALAKQLVSMRSKFVIKKAGVRI